VSDALVNGVLAGYGIAIPVGAIAVLIVGVGMRLGFTTAASAGAGAATADLLYALVAATAGAAAARILEPWAGPIRVLSGMALILLAGKGFIDARRAQLRPPRRGPGALRQPAAEPEVAMRRGEMVFTYGRFLALTVINPMTVVYFTTMVLGSGAGHSPTFVEALLFAIGAFAASLSWQTLLAGVGALARRGLSPRFRTTTALVGNLLIVAMAVRILV
jgi:arginine exporter protein ArgO